MQLAMLGDLFLTELRRHQGEDDILGPLSVAETRHRADTTAPEVRPLVTT